MAETVATGISRWEQHVKTVNAASHSSITSTLKGFKEEYGHLSIKKVLPRHVTGWIDSRKTWGPTTKCNAFRRLQTCFRWNCNRGYTTVDPMATMRLPPDYWPRARGEEYALPTELVRLLIDQADGRLKEIVQALAITGARPGELINAERANLRVADCMILHRGDEQRLYVHKTARRKKNGFNDRQIFLDEESLATAVRNAKAGRWLFPAPKGGRWQAECLRLAFVALRRSPAVAACIERWGREERHVIPYSFRHTWITRAIKNGKPIKLVADLCGTSVEKIERHYCHAAADRAWMRQEYLACLEQGAPDAASGCPS